MTRLESPETTLTTLAFPLPENDWGVDRARPCVEGGARPKANEDRQGRKIFFWSKNPV